MKINQLHKDIEDFQKQLKQCLPSLIAKVTNDNQQSLYFQELFQNTKAYSVQELYSNSLLRLEPHIARQQPHIEQLIQSVNELIHQYFQGHKDKLLELLLLEREIKQAKDSSQTVEYHTSSTPETEEKGMEIEQSCEEMCKMIKRKYQKKLVEPICDSCLCDNSYAFRQVIQCLLCEKYFHIACLDGSYNNNVKNYTCPRCALSNMDQFCEVRNIVLKPFPFKKSGLINSKIAKFKADTEIVDIRCLRMDCPQNAEEITWPDLGDLYMNNKKIIEFKPLTQNSSQHKRKDEKVTCSIKSNEECSLQIRESVPNMEHKKNLRITSDQLHYVAVYQTIQYSGKELLVYMTENPSNWMSVEQALDFIILSLNQHIYDDIEVSKLTVSLTCCFSLHLMTTPVRGIYCDHIQCFGLEAYIAMMDLTVPRRWRCPICKSKCFRLQIDALQYAILQTVRSLNLIDSVTEISFDHKGNILHDVIAKSIDFSCLPARGRQNNNRIIQLEQLSNPMNEIREIANTKQETVPSIHHQSIVIE